MLFTEIHNQSLHIGTVKDIPVYTFRKLAAYRSPQLGHNCSRMKYWVARGAGKHMSIIGATSFSSLICINQGISLDLEEANNTLLLSIRGAISDPSYAFVTPFP